MKYHHQKGIVERDKKGHKKLWLGFFMVFAIVSYGGFLFAVLNLNGWPLTDVASTARVVKTTKPTSNKIFIPAINVQTNTDSIKLEGDPSYSDVVVSGPSLGFGITPQSLRQASLFYSIDQLRNGDEVFLDNQGTRYVYEVSQKVSKDDSKLTIKTSNKTVVAKTVGTIVWNDGSPVLETF
ncbi:hypothetical protein A3F64_02870 [Candidatus Saccharibacteria bacterium RIFCSPHIGHO2_12_FULL_42_8]|nr:MAG: hypothetical protein A3F64_02870 [Candidatus Saccharibacteria bacterium RIFCSPHIGHO2_12_FULL_42_8]